MKLFNRKSILILGTLLSAMAMGIQSCSMINEDLPECAVMPNTITRVNFIYDYNMKYTDLFTDHVGSVYLYIFDDNGKYLHRESKYRVQMGNTIDFSMAFDTTLLKPGHTYEMVAMAQGNRAGYAASLTTPGFQVLNEMVEGVSTINDYLVRLDRKHEDGTSGVGEFEFKDIYGNTQTQIDTIWSTKPDEVQTVRIPSMVYVPTVEKLPDYEVEVTIPMMRITNAITVNLANTAFTHETEPEDYKMIIHFPQGNGTIDFTGTILPYETLDYRTLRKSLITYIPGNEREEGNGDDGNGEENPDNGGGQATRATAAQYAVQGVFGVSRLMTDDESSLQIYDNKTGQLLEEIPNFSQFLANAFDYYGDDAQEFLDREYNFEVTLGITQAGLAWIDLYIEVMGWYVRINNIGF